MGKVAPQPRLQDWPRSRRHAVSTPRAMGLPPQPLRLLLRAVCIACLLQLDLAAAANERWQDTSLHHDVDHITADVDPRGYEWYPGKILPTIEAPWHTQRSGCVLMPEEGRLPSSTRDKMRNEVREFEPQLNPHLQRDSTGLPLHSWWGQERPPWNTATYAGFGDTSNLHSTVGGSSYGDVMTLGGHSVKGASPNWLAVVDSHDQYEVSEEINYHPFYHDPKNSPYTIPLAWYHGIPHEHGSVSHSNKLPDGSSPSGINGRSELHRTSNARKQWNTLGCIPRNGGKHFHYHDSSDEKVFKDHGSREETTEEDLEFSEWTDGRPLLVLDQNDKNHYLQDGCSCCHKHGIGYHGAEVAVDTGFKNMDEELAKVACKTELAPGRVEGGTEPFDLATVPVEESYGKQKPEFEQRNTGQDGVPDDKQDQKILLLFEDFSTEADELPQNTETVFDGVPNDEKLDSRLDSGNQKPEYHQHNTGQDGNPGEIQDHKILILFEDFPIEGGELPQNTETVLDGVSNGEKLDSGSISGNQQPEYDHHNTGEDANPDEIQDHKILVVFEDFPIEVGELPQNTETVLDGVPNDEKLDFGPDSGYQNPEYEQHNTGHDGNPAEIQDHKILVLLEDFPTEAVELPQNKKTLPGGEKLESVSLDQVSKRQCQKEDDQFGHYVLRCEEEFGDVKGQRNPVHSDKFSAEIGATNVEVEEHHGPQPRDESVVIHKRKYDVLEPIGCSENLAPSDNNSFEKIESPLITEITPEQSKLDKLFTELAPSLVVEFDGKENTVREQQFTERQDVPATPQAHKDIILLDRPDKRDTETQAVFGAYVPVSYGKQCGLFGLHENSMRDSSQTINIYDDYLRADNFPGEANEVSWQEKVQPVEEKWNSEPVDQVSIYKDESFGNQKWEQYVTAWKDVLEALKSGKDITQSENFAFQIDKDPWKTEKMAQKDWKSDSFDQVDVCIDDSYYKPKTEWEYYSNARKGKHGMSSSGYSILFPGFASNEAKTTYKSVEIPEEETPDSELWEKHKILYDSIKTDGYPAYVDGSDAETLYLDWGSEEDLGYESFAGAKVQLDEAHGNQKVTPVHYGTEWLGPFDATENRDQINCETFSDEAAYVPGSHKVEHEDEANRYGTFAHIGGGPDESFRIQIPLELYKPINWRTVSDGTSYELRGTDNSQWDEHVQRGVPMGEEAFDRTVAIGLPAAGVIYDADTSARGQWNIGTHQLPQKEYIPYESHDTKPITHCNCVRKAKSRTPLVRSKVGRSKKTKKWREDFEGIALPFEWPTKENFVQTREHPHAEIKCCTGRKLHGLEGSKWEADEHSWSVNGGRMTSDEWSSSGSLEWSSSAEERPDFVAPLSNMIEGFIRVFTGPFQKAAGHVKNWRERKAERSRSCTKEAGFEPRTAVTVTPAPLSPSRLRAYRRHRTLEARKRRRGRLTGLMGGLLMGACGGGHTTVEITMPDD